MGLCGSKTAAGEPAAAAAAAGGSPEPAADCAPSALVLRGEEALESFVSRPGAAPEAGAARARERPGEGLAAVVAEPCPAAGRQRGAEVRAAFHAAVTLRGALGFRPRVAPLWGEGAGQEPAGRAAVQRLLRADLCVFGAGEASVRDEAAFAAARAAPLTRDGLVQAAKDAVLLRQRTHAEQLYAGSLPSAAALLALLALVRKVREATDMAVFGHSRDLERDDDSAAASAAASGDLAGAAGAGAGAAAGAEAGAEAAENSASASSGRPERDPLSGQFFHLTKMTRLASMSPLDVLSDLALVIGSVAEFGERMRVRGAGAGEVSRGWDDPRFAVWSPPADADDDGDDDDDGARRAAVMAELRPYVAPPAVADGMPEEVLEAHAATARQFGGSVAGRVVAFRGGDECNEEAVLFVNFALRQVRRCVRGNVEYFAGSKKFGWLLELPVAVEALASARLDGGGGDVAVAAFAVHWHSEEDGRRRRALACHFDPSLPPSLAAAADEEAAAAAADPDPKAPPPAHDGVELLRDAAAAWFVDPPAAEIAEESGA